MLNTLRKSVLLLSAAVIGHTASAQWTTNPMLNTKVRDTAGYSAAETKIATAANGNSFIVWSQSSPTGYKLRLQLVDANGYNLWNNDGLMLDSLLGSTLYRFDMKVDNEGNAIIANQDQRSGSARWPVVFKVNQAGASLWGTAGAGLQLTDTAATATSGLSPVICVTDSNNVIVAWSASGSKTYVSYQKISAAGVQQWTKTVLDPANTGPRKYERPKMVVSSGESFIMQYVSRTGTGLGISTMFAQRYDGNGAALWAAPAQVSTKTIGFAYFPEPVSDGYGGMFLSFTGPNPSSAAISAVWGQRIYADGHVWNATGNVLYLNGTQQSFESGSAFVPAQNKYFAGMRVTSNSQGQAGIWLQRVDTAGNLDLTTTGYQVVPLSGGAAADIVYGAGMQPAGNGIIFLYCRGSSLPSMPIISKKTNYDGTPAWTTDTAVLSNAASNKSKIVLGAFAHNQVVAAWVDNRSSTGGVYAQNVLNYGSLGNYPCTTVTINPATLPVDTVGAATPYNVTLTQTGASGPVTWTIASGTLPAGYTLSSTGVLSGGATSPSTGSITIRTTDSNYCTGTQTYTFSVVCPTVALGTMAEVCIDDPAFLLSGGTPAGGTYSGTGVSGGSFDPAVSGAGTFDITYVYTTGSCIDSAVQNITVKDCATGVTNSTANALHLGCFPNPAGELLTVSCSGASGHVSVRILSMDGRVVASVNGQSGKEGYRQNLDLRNCQPGFYQVVLRCDAGTAVQRILVHRE